MARRESRRMKAYGGAVGACALAAMAVAFGAPGAATAAPVPNTLAPSVQAAATPAAAPSVGSVPVVGPIVSPAPVSSAPASPTPGSGVKAQASNATITVTPDTNLTNGQQVTVTGHGFAASSAGGMAECNGTPNQPTQQVYGNAVPVGCTNPLHSLQATDATGSFSASFTIKTGTVGPPASGTDSANNDGAADAAKYPCPPTPAQQQQGVTCSISYGDASGNQASADLHFASTGSSGGGGGGTQSNATSASTPGSTAAGGSTSASGGSAGSGGSGGSASSPTSGSTDSSGGAASSGGSLPFTGFGVGMWRLTVLGVLLSFLGAGMIVLGRRPALARRLWGMRPALALPLGTLGSAVGRRLWRTGAHAAGRRSVLTPH